MDAPTGAAALLLLAATLTGCAGAGGGGAATATAPPTASASGVITPAPSGAPATANVQLVPGNLLCDALTSEQIRSTTGVDVASSAASEGTAGTECDFRDSDGSPVVVLEDQSQQLLTLGATGAQVAAALQARGGVTALTVNGADLALLSNATAVPAVYLLVHGHWFYLGLTTGSASDPNSAVTTLAAQAVALLSTEVQ